MVFARFEPQFAQYFLRRISFTCQAHRAHPDAPDACKPADMVFWQQLPAFIAPIVSAAIDDYLSCKQETCHECR
jgi:hypothetical protein